MCLHLISAVQQEEFQELFSKVLGMRFTGKEAERLRSKRAYILEFLQQAHKYAMARPGYAVMKQRLLEASEQGNLVS